jgi:hypothetical protein
MPVSDQLARVTPYAVRLLNDEYIQDQIGAGLTSLRASAKRARAQRANQVLEDQRLHKQLRNVMGSFSNAVRALRQPPQSKRHPVRRSVLVLAGVGVAAAAGQTLRSASGGTDG